MDTSDSHSLSTDPVSATPLCVHVKQALELYFSQLKGHDAVNVYSMVMAEVEKPLLETALAYCGYNQSKAAKLLGLSRSTLRKKMEHYRIS